MSEWNAQIAETKEVAAQNRAAEKALKQSRRGRENQTKSIFLLISMFLLQGFEIWVWLHLIQEDQRKKDGLHMSEEKEEAEGNQGYRRIYFLFKKAVDSLLLFCVNILYF